jgi:multiple sugar transport system substrate-binding protein
VVRAVLIVCLVAAAGWWLFADTVGKYVPSVAARPLRVSFWGPFQEFRMWKEMLANFRRRHPGIAVKMEYFPSRYQQKIGQLLVADDAPDVILYQDEPFPNIIERDPDRGIEPKFANLTKLAAACGEGDQLTREALLKTFWTTSVDYFGRWEGRGEDRAWQQYGMPVWGGCNLFYYNKACFERAGLRVARLPRPKGLVQDANGGGWLVDDEKWDLDEFVAVCKLLTLDSDGDGRNEQFGLSLNSSLYWLPLHYACGADVLNEGLTHTVFMGPAVEKSLRLWQDMMYTYGASPRSAELGQMNEGVGFFTGRVAMFCSGPWGMPFLNETGMDYDVLHVPRNPQTRQRATRITWDSVAILAAGQAPGVDGEHEGDRQRAAVDPRPAGGPRLLHLRQSEGDGAEVRRDGRVVRPHAAGDEALVDHGPRVGRRDERDAAGQCRQAPDGRGGHREVLHGSPAQRGPAAGG